MIENTDKYLVGTPVVLTDDLTRYHPSLIKGSKGVTVGGATQTPSFRGYNSRFVKVQFEEVLIDILWKGLELGRT
jgi:hypothetical protein